MLLGQLGKVSVPGGELPGLAAECTYAWSFVIAEVLFI